MSRISSRERILAALRYGETDTIPLYFNTFGIEPPPPARWSDQVEEAEYWLARGVDALLKVGTPIISHPSLTISSWEENLPGERWPLMVKEYETPVGALRQEVWKTEDWVSDDWPGHKDDEDQGISFTDDFNF